MNSEATKTSLIVETPRGPSLVGTRITVYSVMDYIKEGWSRLYIITKSRIVTAGDFRRIRREKSYSGSHARSWSR
ncbi:MAG TPA: hypothetical protein VE715_16120 [Blastocatellia bacterium]|nr:hypothetical protein [Blastocatellia bacterium]